MCYPKPGPRCSAYAAARLTQAKLNARLAPNSFDNPQIRQNYLDAKESVVKAEAEYDTTPAGIKELERRVRDRQSSSINNYELRLERGIALRKAMLEAVKHKDEGDILHEGNSTFTALYQAKGAFPANDEPRKKIEMDSPDVSTMIDESREWTHRLSADEIEAVSWFTSNGAGSVNARLLGLKHSSPWHYEDEYLDKTIADIDSATEKWKRDEPIVVYRGISGADDEKLEGEDYANREFPLGSTYSSAAFQSSSLDPDRASGFGVTGVTLEILSKRAAPVMNVSAWSIAEKEMILPRNVKYKVVGHIKNAPIGKEDNEDFIVQLIEED